MIMKYIILFIILMCKIIHGQTSVVVLRAIIGRDAHLPCGQGKVFLDGPDSFVHWLKNERDLLHRYPADGSHEHDRSYTVPCVTGDCRDETTLVLKRVTKKDAGLYRCRVHYQASPSVDHLIDLRLVSPPGEPKIYKDSGEPVDQGYIGPVSLGTNLNLTCQVIDGRADTLVFWRRNGVPLANASVDSHGVQRATLLLTNMDRSQQEAHYECVAQNSDVTEPLVSSFVIKMFLPPLLVEIRLNNNLDFEAGQARVVDCVVVGCVPPPAISWHLGSLSLKSNSHKELHDGNFTLSSLTLAPSLRDNKSNLTCTARNSFIPRTTFQDNVILNVGFRPMCMVAQKTMIGVVKGEVETATCIVDASPAPAQFSWIFSNSKTLYTSAKKVPGHFNRYSSSLVWTPNVDDLGELTCRATNTFGEQKKPCTFTITSGGRPVPPACAITISEPKTIIANCNKTWDGGRPQTIHLDLLDSNGKVFKTVTNRSGIFYLTNLSEKFNITLVSYASNERGTSDATAVHIPTLMLEKETESIIDDIWTTCICVAFFMSSMLFVVGIKYLVSWMKIRQVRRNAPDVVPSADGVFYREPDSTSEDQLAQATNISFNQSSPCQNENSVSPLLARRAIRCSEIPMHVYPSSQRAYYV